MEKIFALWLFQEIKSLSHAVSCPLSLLPTTHTHTHTYSRTPTHTHTLTHAYTCTHSSSPFCSHPIPSFHQISAVLIITVKAFARVLLSLSDFLRYVYPISLSLSLYVSLFSMVLPRAPCHHTLLLYQPPQSQPFLSRYLLLMYL